MSIYKENSKSTLIFSNIVQIYPYPYHPTHLNFRLWGKTENIIMPLFKEKELLPKMQAIISSFTKFKRNFNIFTKNFLDKLNFTNLVIAGEAVAIVLLSVPKVNSLYSDSGNILYTNLRSENQREIGDC